MYTLTGPILKSICPNLYLDRAIILANLFNQSAIKYSVTTLPRIHAFLAQIAHESGEFSIKTENMNYTTPQVIVNTWPSRFSIDGSDNKLKASDYTRQPEKLANSVYANRMGNGDVNSGDGFRYRGGGFLQLTGKESYQAYAKYIGKNVAETSDLVHTTDQYALDSAFWEFCIDKQLLDEADRGEFITITRRINGGIIGLPLREKYYTRCKKYIV